jgi:adenylate cyclase
VERRLATILVADVAGYSALMERDEAGTFTRLKAHRQEVFEPVIKQHRGRIFKLTGDGVLAEFASVVDAVQCAVAVQRQMDERNGSLPEKERIHVRIGVNLGDVIVEGKDRHGEGVNIAARLQQLAQPGGIVISGTAYDQLKSKVDVGYEFLGEQRVKNIAAPVRVYNVSLDPKRAGTTIHVPGLTKSLASRPWFLTVTALVLALVLGLVWLKSWAEPFEPDLPLPDKPSVAVLPFVNMSADSGQAYFADGMTDNLITDLSQIPGLFVISRNSTFAYKDKAVDPRQVAKELGVRYVLEGSVQRSADEVRINAQLIDAVTGGHVWAQRFDGPLANVFALQDKVTRSIAATLALRLTASVQIALGKNETDNPAAYDLFLRGLDHLRRRTPQEFANAIPLFEQAIKLDSEYGQAYAALSWIYVLSYQRRWFDVLQISDVEARRRAKNYLIEAQKRPTALSHQAAGEMLGGDGDYRGALAEFKEAIVLDPGDAVSYILMADALTLVGRAAEALPLIRTAMRLDPLHPPYFTSSLGVTQYKLGEFKDAAASFEEAARLDPDDSASHLWVAATYAHLGRKEDAKAAIARYDQLIVQRGWVPAALDTTTTRLQEGLILAGISKTLAASEFALANRLQPEELRQLFFGHRLHGRNIRTGIEHEAAIANDGAAALSGDWAIYSSGKALIEDSEMCIVWPDNQKSCGGVSRNPGGTTAKENEFIWFLNQNPMTFSQTD